MASKLCIILIVLTVFILLSMKILEKLEFFNFNLHHYIFAIFLPSAVMMLWLLFEFIKFKIKGE